MKKNYQVFVSGDVQGVGFRYTTRNLAHKYGLTGWVKNLSDGRVEFVACADSMSIKNLVNDLKEEFKDFILEIEIKEIAINEESSDFSIRL